MSAVSGPIGVGLCEILDMSFREAPSSRRLGKQRRGEHYTRKEKGPGDLSGTLLLVGLEATITSDFASFRADSLACSQLDKCPPAGRAKLAENYVGVPETKLE